MAVVRLYTHKSKHLLLKTQGAMIIAIVALVKNVVAEIAIKKQLNGTKPLRGETLSDEQIKSFLWSLSLEKELSMSTCSQAFHALNFFYKTVLNRTFKERLLPRVLRVDLSSELTCLYL